LALRILRALNRCSAGEAIGYARMAWGYVEMNSFLQINFRNFKCHLPQPMVLLNSQNCTEPFTPSVVWCFWRLGGQYRRWTMMCKPVEKPMLTMRHCGKNEHLNNTLLCFLKVTWLGSLRINSEWTQDGDTAPAIQLFFCRAVN
jgi:hypothetical protein